ncbi:S24 family peptidase [uncultured Martelella sp.]|uniref:S24 family peptidase n=1 Tax=uncultured Martelella sp. TaxID=392331 RepID=UPI0029C7107A|nr:S24 family peptidase [uncultured Martelella sp.]
MSRDALRKLLAKPTSKPSAEMLEGLNKAYGVSVQWLLHGGSDTPLFDGDATPRQEATENPPTKADQAAGIPIKGSVAAAYVSGEAGADDAVIGAIQTPPTLAHIKGIYALYVDGTSMEPQYFPGDLIFLNPARPARKGDCVVIVTDHGTGPQRSLGIYTGENGDTVYLKKRDPQRPEGTDIAIPKKHIKARHKVLTINEIFGA